VTKLASLFGNFLRTPLLTIFDKGNIKAVMYPLGIWITLLAQCRRWCSLFSSLRSRYAGKLCKSWSSKELSGSLSDSSILLGEMWHLWPGWAQWPWASAGGETRICPPPGNWN